MAAFLYFHPGDDPPTQDELRKLGFAHVDLAELPGCGVNNGPSGGRGYVFTLAPPVHPAGVSPNPVYLEQRQTWRETHDGKLWLGWETASPPCPEDVQRNSVLVTGPGSEPDGQPIQVGGFGRRTRLNDGNEWVIPAVGIAIEVTKLPTVYGCDAQGNMVAMRVEAKFQDLWALVQRLTEAIRPQWDPEKFSPDEIVDVISLALALNYRVSRWEVLHLGFLSPESMQNALLALLDFPVEHAIEVH